MIGEMFLNTALPILSADLITSDLTNHITNVMYVTSFVDITMNVKY